MQKSPFLDEQQSELERNYEKALERLKWQFQDAQNLERVIMEFAEAEAAYEDPVEGEVYLDEPTTTVSEF